MRHVIVMLAMFSCSFASAAEIVRSIGSGKTYTDVSSWEAASYDCTASDDAIGELYGTVTENNIAFTDSTPLSIILRAAAGEEHDGTPDSGATIQTGSTGHIILWQTTGMPPTTIEGIELQRTAASTGFFVIVTSGATNLTINRLIMHGTGGTSGNVLGVAIANTNTTLIATNNIICDFTSSTTGLHRGFNCDGTGTLKLMNNTVTNLDCSSSAPVVGIAFSDLSAYEIRNNLVTDLTGSGGTSCYGNSSPSNAVTSHNISDDATSPNSAYRSKTITFADAGTSDYHLAASETDAIDQGSTDADVPSDDIDGDTRDASPDIGADEYVSATSTVLFHQQRRRR